MKKYFTVVLLLSAMLYCSCKKASGPADAKSVQQDNNRDSTVSVSATINGTAWTTTGAYGYSVKSATDSGKTDLQITATQKVHDTVTTLSFVISPYTGIGVYTIDPPAYSATYYKGNERHFATIGQIFVQTDSNFAITGTFDFVADSITVTNGKFNIAKP